MKVMVVDDEPAILVLMRTKLNRKGHTVLTYENPMECPLYDTTSCPGPDNTCPDVIITDYDMPIVNGIDFLVNVLQRGCKCNHIAIFTGKGLDEEDVNRMAKYGSRHFLKPLDFDEMFDWIDRVERKAV